MAGKIFFAITLLAMGMTGPASARTYGEAMRACSGSRFEVKRINGRTYYSCTRFNGPGFLCPASDRQ